MLHKFSKLHKTLILFALLIIGLIGFFLFIKPESRLTEIYFKNCPNDWILAANIDEALYKNENPGFKALLGDPQKPGAPTVVYQLREDLSKAVSFTLREVQNPKGEKITPSFSNPPILNRWWGKDQLIYQEVIPDYDLSYQIIAGKGIKEEIIIKKRSDFNTFVFDLELFGVEPKLKDCTWRFYLKGTDKEVFYFKEPFMEDKNGARSNNVEIELTDGSIILRADSGWLSDPTRVYPVIIDPTIQLTILNIYSHPQAGDNWAVSFETKGTDDLIISPIDQATINDLDFVSLKCGERERTPQILENDVIFYPNWTCDVQGQITHLVNVAAPHTLKFQFGEKIAYAYNSPDTTIYSGTADGWVAYQYGATHAEARGATDGTSNGAAGGYTSKAMVDGYVGGSGYEIYRSFFYFDTSGLPDNAIINTAIFSLYGYYYAESNVAVLKGTQADPLSNADYDAFSGSEYGHTSSWNTDAYNNITFNELGKSEISLTGTTLLCAMNYSYDYLNVDPYHPTEPDRFRCGCYYANYAGTYYDPKLYVEYTIPNQAPTAPTSLLCEGATNPTNVTDLTPEFSAIYNDPDSGDIANKYRVEVNTASNFTGTVMWDSGADGTAMANCTQGNRCQDVSYAGTALSLNGATYYWRIRFWDDSGDEGAVSTESASFSIIQPYPSNCIVKELAGGGGPLTIEWSDNSDNETGFEIDKSTDGGAWVDLTTTAANVTSYEDFSVSNNHTYQYRIRAKATTVDSDWCTTAVVNLGTGSFKFEGIQMEGIKIDQLNELRKIVENSMKVLKMKIVYAEIGTGPIFE